MEVDSLGAYVKHQDVTTPPAAQSAQKHRANMALYAQDAAETDKPWERWQYADKDGNWYDCAIHPSWAYPAEYRRKKATPPAARRQWAGLSEEQKLSLEILGGKSDVMLAELVEGWLKEKNT
jgi:hypothetical protein